MSALSRVELTPKLIENFIENTPIAYILLDEERRIHYINKSFLNLRNLDLSTTLGEYCYNISNGGTPCDNCAVENAIISNTDSFVTRCDKLPDGSTKYIDDYAIPLHNISDDNHKYILEIMVNRSTEMQLKEKRNNDFTSLVSIISDLLESKDLYTASHSSNVHTLAYHIATAMDLPPDDVFEIALAAKLHDIGKVGIPNSIINKPSRLTDEEYEIIKSHPARSYDMIKELPSFKNIAKIVRHHHERIDGKGYPDGLKGDEISIGARIVAVADTFEAMTSDRSYRKALSAEVAIKEMKRVAGTQLDAEIVDVFEKLHFDYETYSPASTKKSSSNDDIIERNLAKQQIISDKSNFSNLKFNNLNRQKILQEIFNNTPCGYVLMKPDFTVLYTSPYFLKYMGLEEHEVIDHVCYTVSQKSDSHCEECALQMALKLNRPYSVRKTQQTRNGIKSFDMYGVPLRNEFGFVEYLIEIILDRTEEVRLENERTEDYKKLFKTLTELIRIKSRDEDDADMIAKIPELQNKCRHLFHE